jgi:hypothetical protein
MIHTITHNLFYKYAQPGIKIIELGDQLMDIGQETQFMRSDEFYKKEGIDIESIDIHGKNRALPIDLSKESKKRFEADLLTDFGTVEHVSDLYNALLNCHNWTKEGGIMIHANPKTGTYAGHGVSFFTMDFWEQLSLACNYHLLEVGEKSPYSEENPDKEVIAVLKKNSNSDFIPKEEFKEIADRFIFAE